MESTASSGCGSLTAFCPNQHKGKTADGRESGRPTCHRGRRRTAGLDPKACRQRDWPVRETPALVAAATLALAACGGGEAEPTAAPVRGYQPPASDVAIERSLATREAMGSAPASQPSNTQAQRGFVSRDTWSESTPWPLTVDQGRLLCIDRGGHFQAVYLEVEGQMYGVNGWANAWADEYGAELIEPIWLVNDEHMEMMRELFPNEEITPTYISIGPLLDKGLQLCD